ncbi:hypothetical protein ABZP36_029801 [Zizania latifolia]
MVVSPVSRWNSLSVKAFTLSPAPTQVRRFRRRRHRRRRAPPGLLRVLFTMAASSPVSSGKAASDSPAPAVANGNGTPQKLPPASAFDMPKPNLRGLNKPKCIQCGNVARSRCPFQCCKSCCYKAQNPCHIHVRTIAYECDGLIMENFKDYRPYMSMTMRMNSIQGMSNDNKLKELLESKSTYEDDNPSDRNLDDHPKPVKVSIKQQMERGAKMSELLGKMVRAQSEGDLKPCAAISAQLFGKENGSSMGTSSKSQENELLPNNQESGAAVTPPYSFPKLWAGVEVDAGIMSKINDEFSSSSEVVQL